LAKGKKSPSLSAKGIAIYYCTLRLKSFFPRAHGKGGGGSIRTIKYLESIKKRTNTAPKNKRSFSHKSGRGKPRDSIISPPSGWVGCGKTLLFLWRILLPTINFDIVEHCKKLERDSSSSGGESGDGLGTLFYRFLKGPDGLASRLGARDELLFRDRFSG